MDHRRTPKLTLGLALTLGVAAGCGGATEAQGEDEFSHLEVTHLTVGSLPLPDYAALYWAKDHGHFEAEGLTVELEPLQGGPIGIQRVASGDLDCSFANSLSTVIAQTSDVPVSLMALSSAVGDGSQIYAVAEDSPVQTMEDIVDVTVGVHTTNNVADLLFLALAEERDIDVSPNFVEVPMSEMIDGILAGSIEVGYMGEPFAMASKAAGLREVVDLTEGSNRGLPLAGFICGTGFVNEHPQTAAAFQRALYAAGANLAEDEAGLRDWSQNEGGVSEELAEGMTLPQFYNEFDSAALTMVIDLLDSQGLLDKEYDMDAHVFQP